MKTFTLLLIFSGLSFVSKSQTASGIDSLIRVAASQKDSIRSATILKIGQLYNRKGLVDSAEHYFKLLLTYAESQKIKTQICVAHLSLGGINIHKDNFDLALDEFFKAISIAEKEDWGKYIADADIGIGYIYIIQKREKDALQFFLNSEKELLKQKVKDTMYLVNVYTHLAQCLGAIGDTARGIAYFKTGSALCDSYELYNSHNPSKTEYLNLRRLSLIYNISNFLTDKNDIANTLKKVKAIQEGLQNGKDDFQLFKALNIIAVFELKLNNYDKALHFGELALKIFNKPGYDNNYKDIYLTIAKSAAALKQYEKAYLNLSLASNYNDSIYNSVKLEEINSVEAKYKTEKKEQEILTLNKEKKAQRIITWLAVTGLAVATGFLFFVVRSGRLRQRLLIQEKETQRAELEKRMYELEQTALRAQMNPHFIFNCLNSVQRYVINNDVNGVNNYLSIFASLIRQTLENSGKPLISLKNELQYLDTYIKVEQMRGGNNFNCEIKVGENIDTSDIFIPNMIIQPYVENSIKHGAANSAEKGMLSLRISRNQKLICVVEDNGEGINKTLDNPGDKTAIHVPMGSRITEKRIEMYNTLHADKIELEVIDKSDMANAEPGTRVTLKFPLSN